MLSIKRILKILWREDVLIVSYHDKDLTSSKAQTGFNHRLTHCVIFSFVSTLCNIIDNELT